MRYSLCKWSTAASFLCAFEDGVIKAYEAIAWACLTNMNYRYFNVLAYHMFANPKLESPDAVDTVEKFVPHSEAA